MSFASTSSMIASGTWGHYTYLKNSGKLEIAQHIANHENPRTTKLYDRRQDEISLDEVERIAIPSACRPARE
jgi:hypothetical protein